MKRIFIPILVILSFVVSALAAPGDLDLTFNGTGKATVNFGTGTAVGRHLAIQSDGKIVVAGYYQETGSTRIALARYNQNGSLDTTFDGDGRVTTAITNIALFVSAVAIQADGKIVVSGIGLGFQSTLFVFRYNTDGSPDLTFDFDGFAQTPEVSASGTNRKTGLVIQNDGKIVVAGNGFFSGSGYDFCVARFNPNGSLDTTFDTDGIVNTSTTPNWDYGSAVAIQTDGKIIVTGQSRNDADGWDQITVVRYNSDGSLDNSFDGDGKLTVTVGNRFGDDGGQSVAIQNDNKIVIAGFATTSTSRDFALLRLNSNGSLDTTFDSDGKLTTNFSGTSIDFAESVAIQPDGKIIAAGRSIISTNDDFAFVRYNADGTLDSSFADTLAPNAFGNGGKVTVDFANGQDKAFGVKLDSSGKIVASGESGTSFATVRLEGLAPSAANVSISGRVLTTNGSGLRNAIVSLTDEQGITRSTRTGTFGYYRFDEVQVGQTVVIHVQSKRFQFEPRVLTVSEVLTDLDFTPIGNSFEEK